MGLKKDKAVEYRAKYGSEMPTLKLARLLYNENKVLFTDVEDARKSLRYIEGKTGSSNRKHVTKLPTYMEQERPKNPYSIPKTWAKDKQVFTLPTGCNRVGVWSDPQIPFHDEVSIRCLIKWFQEMKINTLLINGDFVDNYNVSDYVKDPKYRNFVEEIDMAKEIFRWVRAELPNVTIYYNMNANHELRWERFLRMKAKEVFGFAEFQLENMLKLNDYNVIPLKEYSHIMVGKLPILHGHTIFGRYSNTVSKAKTLFDKLKHSAMCSHVHITDEFNTKDHVTGKMFTCWTTGCTMNLNVEYNEHGNQYNHGGAFIEVFKDGDYSVTNKRILNGKIL